MTYYVVLIIFLLFYMSIWFIVSMIKKRNDIADIAWGLGFVLISWFALLLTKHMSLSNILVCVLISIWGIRLSWYIYKRNKKKSEDYRYVQMKSSWGRWYYVRSYLQIFLLQGFFIFLIVFPVIHSFTITSRHIQLLNIIGVFVWCLGFLFEVISDAQLMRFKSNPINKGKIMQEGLWAYSRHPNYFGEVMLWWGVWCFVFVYPYGLFTVIGPVTITILILKVSGIPLLQEKMKHNPEYNEYKKSKYIFPLA